MSDALPSVDVVIPAYNEERHIGRCLDCVLAQDYPRDLLNVWVVDAGSDDRTAEHVQARASADARVHVLGGNGRRLMHAEALSTGIAAGRAPLVARVDARTFVEPQHVRRAVEVFASEGDALGAVGGDIVHEGETPFGRAVALARNSRAGVGASVFAERSRRRHVDTALCPVYRRAALDAVGGFDPAMAYGEDEELHWRLRRAGWTIVLDAGMPMHYLARDNFGAVFRQYRNYGAGRVRVVRRHPSFLRPYHLVPSAAAAAGATLAVLGTRSAAARRALLAGGGLYAAVVGGAAVAAARPHGGARLAARVATAMFALHAGYAVGTLREAARGR